MGSDIIDNQVILQRICNIRLCIASRLLNSNQRTVHYFNRGFYCWVVIMKCLYLTALLWRTAIETSGAASVKNKNQHTRKSKERDEQSIYCFKIKGYTLKVRELHLQNHLPIWTTLQRLRCVKFYPDRRWRSWPFSFWLLSCNLVSRWKETVWLLVSCIINLSGFDCVLLLFQFSQSILKWTSCRWNQ